MAQWQRPIYCRHQRQRGRLRNPAHRLRGHFRQRHLPRRYRRRSPRHSYGTGHCRQTGYRPGPLHGAVRRQPHRVQPGRCGAARRRGHPPQAHRPGRRPPRRPRGCPGQRGRAHLHSGQRTPGDDLRPAGRRQRHLPRRPHHRRRCPVQYALHPGVRGPGRRSQGRPPHGPGSGVALHTGPGCWRGRQPHGRRGPARWRRRPGHRARPH